MHLPNGSQIFIESERSAVATVTKFEKVDNAHNLVKATLAGSGGAQNVYTESNVGDFVIITESTWGKMVDRVLRVSKKEASNVLYLEGMDVTDSNQFPGTGNGALVRIKDWHEIPCVQDLSQDGGEQQFYTYQCLSDDQEQQVPTYKSAVSITYTFAHDFESPIYDLLRKLDQDGTAAAMRMYIPKAQEIRCWSGVLAFNDIPKTTMNEMETVSLSCALRGRFSFMHSVQHSQPPSSS